MAPGTPEETVVLSNFLRAETAGGARFEDFTSLLATPASELRDRPGLRVYAR